MSDAMDEDSIDGKDAAAAAGESKRRKSNDDDKYVLLYFGVCVNNWCLQGLA